MATRHIETWNETPASNNFPEVDGGEPEGRTRIGINDSARIRMSAMSTWYQDTEWLDILRDPTDRDTVYTVAPNSGNPTTEIDITSGGEDLDASGDFPVGRRIRTTTAGVATDDLEVLSVSYSNPTTTVEIYSLGGDTVTAGIDGLLLHAGKTLQRFAFQNTLPSSYIVMGGLTDADFVSALAAVPAAGGTILLLAGVTDLTQEHAIPDKTRIIGQGIGISILSTTDETLDRLLYQASGTGFCLESFTLTTPVTTTSGTNHMVELGTCTKVRIKDIFFDQSYGAAIKFTGVSHGDVVIEGCEFYRNRGGCVISPDDNTDVEKCFIRDCSLRDPGFSHTGTSYGLQLAGRWHCSGIQITELDNGGAAIPIGIEFSEKLAANPNEQDANHCSLTNFSITGSGQNARGVDLNGRYCSVTDGSIALSGSGSTGVKVAGQISEQLAQNNRTANVSFSGCAIGYDEPNTAAIRNSVVGCTFDACGVDVRLGATLAMVSACTMDGATTQSLSVVAGATRTLIAGNQIYNNTGNGITVSSGADRTRVQDNVLDTCAGDGINVESGATNTIVERNRADSVAGDDFVNDGTASRFVGNIPKEDQVFYWLSADLVVTTNPADLGSLSALAFPTGDGGPDGIKEYVIDVVLACKFSSAFTGPYEALTKLYMGANGTRADTLKWSMHLDVYGDLNSAPNVPNQIIATQLRVVPAAGDKLGLSVEEQISSLTWIVHGNATEDADYGPGISRVSIRRSGNET